ncbi:MAG TPA: hypothetical protein VFI92_14655 [Steroidobacteraceae bacterium]|nr:hypothetical protein [Steroidobacteraceae bacterium]
MNSPDPGSSEHPRYRLADCRQVSVCDLTGAERFIVWAIRWRASVDAHDALDASCLDDAFERAGLRSVQPAFERFVAAACPMASACKAADRLGCWRLQPLEAHALHAIACLQAGLLGEAWKALAQVCARREVGRALIQLEELAAALDRIGGRIERWFFDEKHGTAAMTA